MNTACSFSSRIYLLQENVIIHCWRWLFGTEGNFKDPPPGLLIVSLWLSKSEDTHNDQLTTGMQKCEQKLKQKLVEKMLLLVIKLLSCANRGDAVDCPV